MEHYIHMCFECDTGETLHRDSPALLKKIFAENFIQTILDWSAKKNIKIIHSFWYLAVKS